MFDEPRPVSAPWRSGPSGSAAPSPGAAPYDGWQSVHCEVKFTDHEVKVEAYAFVKVAKADTAVT
jgi:hypothetical protein